MQFSLSQLVTAVITAATIASGVVIYIKNEQVNLLKEKVSAYKAIDGIGLEKLTKDATMATSGLQETLSELTERKTLIGKVSSQEVNINKLKQIRDLLKEDDHQDLLSDVEKLILEKTITNEKQHTSRAHYLAIRLHDELCSQEHTEACSWNYEIKDEYHNWSKDTHKRMLEKAQKIMENHSDIQIETIVDIAKATKHIPY